MNARAAAAARAFSFVRGKPLTGLAAPGGSARVSE
jgi:hypothetical protein